MNLNSHLKYYTLLYVDDHSSVRSDIYTLLSPSFKSILLAEDVKSAQLLCANNDIDAIITDVEMPGADGLTFVEEIRNKDDEIPIIVLTAFTDTAYLLRAVNLHINGYITKPLTFDKLNNALDIIAKRLTNKSQTNKLSENIFYSPATKQLTVNDDIVSLGKKERILLELFINNHSKTLSKSVIEKEIWPSVHVSDSALKNLLNELRNKLKDDTIIINQPAQGWLIRIKE